MHVLLCFHVSCQVSTWLQPGFSPTRPHGETGKREPWERGWSGACICVPRNSKQETFVKGESNPNKQTNEYDQVGGNKDQWAFT